MLKTVLWNGASLLLGLFFSSVVYGYDSWSSGVRHTQRIKINGYILAANSSRPQDHPRSSHSVSASYLLLHYRGSLVLQALAEQPLLPYHRLWLKGDDAIFDRLVAEEQLFLHVHISGVLREHQPNTGILDLVHIEVIPMYAHEHVTDEKAGR